MKKKQNIISFMEQFAAAPAFLSTYATNATLLASYENLWNGNIGMMHTNLTPTYDHLSDPMAGMLGTVYQYDQLNRLINAEGHQNIDVGNNTWQKNHAHVAAL